MDGKSKYLYFLALAWFSVSCTADSDPDPRRSNYRPLLMTRASLESSFAVTQARPIKKLGKTVQYGNYLFVNEPFKGIHVIDILDPAAPVQKYFLQLPGNIDVAIAEPHFLIADNAVDLLSINISNVLSPSLAYRARNAFPEHLPPDIHRVSGNYSDSNRPKGSVVVGWVKQ